MVTLASGYSQNLEEAIREKLLSRMEEEDFVIEAFEEADGEFREAWEKTMVPPWWLGREDPPDFDTFMGDMTIRFEESEDTGGRNIWGDPQWIYGWFVPVDGYNYPWGYQASPEDSYGDDPLDFLYDRYGDDVILPSKREGEAIEQIRHGRQLVEEITEWICSRIGEKLEEKAARLAHSAELLAEWNSTEGALEDSPFQGNAIDGWSLKSPPDGEIVILERRWQRTVQLPYQQYHVDELTLEAWKIK